jgi:hypothetical protein
MRHQHHVTGLVIVVVQGKEVNLAKHGPGTDDALAVDEKVIAENIDKSTSICLEAAGSNSGIKRCRDGLPAVFFKNLDN